MQRFDHVVRQFIENAEKEIKSVTSEIKESTNQLNRTKDEVVQLEEKRGRLEKEVHKIDQSVGSRRGLLKELEGSLIRLQEEGAQYGATSEIKKTLAFELEEKCQKLKSKKKTQSEKIKKLEEDIDNLGDRKNEIFQVVIEQEQKAVGIKTYVKELETKIIFL